MELINTHCHSCYCGHGSGTIDEYVRAARAAGVATLAFTEHYPLTSAFDPVGRISMPSDAVFRYVEAVKEARHRYRDIEIIVGVELDYLGDAEDRVIAEGDLAPFELVLGSVHFLDRWAFDNSAQRGRWDEPGQTDEIWRRYFELWCKAASDTSYSFDVMSHPDLPKKFGRYPSFDLEPLFDQAAASAAAGGRMIEVNTSGLYYACEEMFPSRALLGAFCRAGVPCTVGADAHEPAHVARDIERAYDLMRAAGYRVVTVPTATGDRRQVSLG